MEKLKNLNLNKKKIIALVCVAVVVILLACMPLIFSGNETGDGPVASILSGTVKTGDITNTILGGGTLTQEDAVQITVPAKVLLTKFLVTNGQEVKAGDAIATVDRVSVQEAVAYVQETLEYLADEIEKADSDTLSSKVTAQAGGTVKVIYAKEGDKVQDVMLENGALAVVSLDGRMRVTLNTEAQIAAGDTVKISLGEGKTVSGNVSSFINGEAVILFEDKGYTAGDPVEVTTADGQSVGTGNMEINSPWNATAYAGTVKAVKVKSGKTVDAGDTLMTLSGTGRTARYQQLVDQHRQYEDMMLQLFQMYQTLQVTAPCDGIVSGIDSASVQLMQAGGGGQISLLANAPNGDDSTQYTNLIGQVAAVGENGWAVLVNSQPVEIQDYKQLTDVNTDTATMTQVSVFDTALAVPLYQLQEGQWVQMPMESVQAGDVILFAGDQQGNFVWLVRIRQAQSQQPSQPGDGEQGSQGGQGQFPSGGGQGSFPNMGGMGGYPQQGGQSEEEEFTLYATDTALIAEVIPQNTMTLEITVDEADVLKLQTGQTATVTVDALTGQSFTATVASVSSSGTYNGGSSKFTVELTMERGADMLAGMNATATVEMETQSNVVYLPVAALVELESKTVVYTGYDKNKEELTDPVEVTVGISDGENVQILTGLTENDTYYYAYYDTPVISNTPDFGGQSFMGGGMR